MRIVFARIAKPLAAALSAVLAAGIVGDSPIIRETEARLFAAVEPASAPIDRAQVDTLALIESATESAFLESFRLITIGDRPYALRLPFGQNGERKDGDGFEQKIFGEGKAEPALLWTEIERLLASDDFGAYRDALALPGPKVVVFDLKTSLWNVSNESDLVATLRYGEYPGTRTKVYVLKTGEFISTADIYNYLYSVGSAGMDCSGFAYFVQRTVARAFGSDLDATYAEAFRAPVDIVPMLTGLWLFDPGNGYAEAVDDAIVNLRPGDIFLFRGHSGEFRHSATIQSIDRKVGIIRYIQDTDWAPEEARGVHDSLIFFDPRDPFVRLRDPQVRWAQRIQPTFEGEPGLIYWRGDGDRYRTQWRSGRSLVVRLEAIKRLVEAADPGFYSSEGMVDEHVRPSRSEPSLTVSREAPP